MTKWEYKFDTSNSDDLRSRLARHGQDGWELVNMRKYYSDSKPNHDVIDFYQLILKRPIQEG